MLSWLAIEGERAIREIQDYLEIRSRLSNQASRFVCPDSCPRYGCREPELHVPVTLLDLILESAVLRRPPSEIYRRSYTLGWSPEGDIPWVGRFTLELRKPCGFLGRKWCRVYPARPIGCAQFPEAWFLRRGNNLLSASRDWWKHYPCLSVPPPVSKERRKVLQTLSKMADQERWASDFYLSGFSPFYIDLRNLVSDLTEMAMQSGLVKSRSRRPGPRQIPYRVIESLFQRKVEESGMGEAITRKIAGLDHPKSRTSLLTLMEAGSEIEESVDPDELVIYNQFKGRSLETYRARPPKSRRGSRMNTTARSAWRIEPRMEKRPLQSSRPSPLRDEESEAKWPVPENHP